MAAKARTGMIIDGVFASEAVDSSGEIVSIEGMDISTMEEGYGVANYEHLGEDGGYGKEIVGRIVYVKKILKESDCEDSRQKEYYSKLKGIPFLYGVVRLYDGAGHEGAKALAAQIRDHVANDEVVLVRYSIEGTTVEKDGNKIKSSLAKRVALTLKPCNRTCVSGVVEDPNAPDGFADVKKAEGDALIDPEFRKLGGARVLECNPCIDEDSAHNKSVNRLLAAAGALRFMRKTLTAGSGDAAPSALTGGPALQRESFIHQQKNQAMAALRDYQDRFTRDGFKKFAKARLPEVSDEFLDHFTDIAEHYHVSKALQKAVEKTSPSLRKPKLGRPFKVPKPLVEDVSDATEALPDEAFESKGTTRKIANGTVRGKALKPNPGMTRPSFDSQKGILHTPVGSFKAYLPKHDGAETDGNYQKILANPEIEGAMDHALTNWSKVHKLLKAGKLPPEVVMHAVMFAQLSPNKPVPTQEIQYARLVDAMDATGLDPRHSDFHQIEQPWKNMDRPDELPWTGREAIRNNPAYYQGGQIGVKRDGEGNIEGRPSMETGRYPGELLSISPLANDFLGRAAQYHKIHDGLVGLTNTHRHDGLSAVGELMNQKTKATNYQNVRRAAVKAGKPDPGPYQGVTVPGLKVKTGLYTWGMMGNGNSVVPDTHFIRNMYGLDLEKDQHTIEYLKNLHWRTTNMPLMKGYNDWYAKNHPAVEYTVNHPKWGSTFEKREDALFPSFWRHWLTIAPHERSLGMPNRSEMAGTTHAPYWEAIAPHVDPLLKGEETTHDSSIPLRTALVHQQYAKDYGEVPAMMMYYRFLVPKLLEAAEHRERVGKDMQFLAKTRAVESQTIELRKSIREALEGKAVPAPRVHTVEVRVNGKLHPAGRYMIHDGHVHHLEDYHGILGSMVPEGPMDAATVSRLHGLEFAPHIVVAPHEVADANPAPAPHEHVIADDPAPPRSPVFEYHRPGMARPHIVEFGPQGAALDGAKLDETDLQLMLDNVSGGVASLRYRSAEPTPLAKAGEDDWDVPTPAPAPKGFIGRVVDRVKGAFSKPSVPVGGYGEDLDPGDALQHVRAAVASGHIHPDVERALTRHIYEDKQAAGIGNMYAWSKFNAKPRPGVIVTMDGNDMKSINDTYGHEAGNTAIRGFASSLRAASDKVGTGKLFRSGQGDEFTAHFPTYEDASTFVRHARTHLDAHPPINGTHRLSVTFGLGNDFASADKALYIAKQGKFDPKFPAKTVRAFAPGHVPHLGHSLVPGAEGPLQMHTEKPPAQAIKPPAAPAQTATAPA